MHPLQKLLMLFLYPEWIAVKKHEWGEKITKDFGVRISPRNIEDFIKRMEIVQIEPCKRA